MRLQKNIVYIHVPLFMDLLQYMYGTCTVLPLNKIEHAFLFSQITFWLPFTLEENLDADVYFYFLALPLPSILRDSSNVYVTNPKLQVFLKIF